MTHKVTITTVIRNEKDEIIAQTTSIGSLPEVVNVPLSTFESPLRDLVLQAGSDCASDLLKVGEESTPTCPICKNQMKKIGDRKKK
jgi:hypothetical protein